MGRQDILPAIPIVQQKGDRHIAVRDLVLLGRRRENRLSPAYEPCEVFGHNEDQVVMKSPKGVEYRRKF